MQAHPTSHYHSTTISTPSQDRYSSSLTAVATVAPLFFCQVPSQLLATNPQAEIQYIHPPLQAGYVQYQPAAAAAAAVANRLSQQLQPQVPRAGAAQFGRPGAEAAFPQSLCMSSILLPPSGLTGKEGGGCVGGGSSRRISHSLQCLLLSRSVIMQIVSPPAERCACFALMTADV
jgi:hypothetical protein